MCACGGETKLLLEDADTIWTGDTVEPVKENLEAGVVAEERFDEVKVKDVLQHLDIVLHAVDNLNLKVAVLAGSNGFDINLVFL